MLYNNLKLQDPTEKHFGDVGILSKYDDNNNNNNTGAESDNLARIYIILNSL